jgi:Tol biopolymer transport system component/tRNA A-37 threonylcarbamoyl transferase component Bud32
MGAARYCVRGTMRPSMTLPVGARIGPYEIVSALGAGGMGEVYRARDAKLNRDVAIKVLLESVSADPDRIARFRREAQVLASLNHPNIAHIHGIEEAGGVTALVLELVEGEDLAQRIAAGPLPLEDALAIATQIAEALEAAHELGVIHRDLKPANVKVRPDGTVKVLDFGLAKALDATGSSSAEAMNSPTLSMHATQAGVVLGTAAYMSPEQARGKRVDRRTDIWSFGVVLYEMLTGRRPFTGDDVTETLASVLKDTPTFNALPAATPPRLRWVLERCLERDPRARLRDIGEARVHLAAIARGDGGMSAAWASAAGVTLGDVQAEVELAVAQVRRHVFSRRVLPLLAVAAIATVAAVVGFTRDAVAPVPPAVTRVVVSAPEGRVVGISVRTMTLSPDGSQLAYVTDGELLLRRLAEFEMHRVAAADLGRNLQSPAFSPDGKWIAYYAGSERTVKRVSIQGGAALRVCESSAVSLEWDTSGILVAQGNGGVVRCNPAGGRPEQLAQVEEGEVVVGPQILPGGDRLLFTIGKVAEDLGTRWDQARVVVQSLRTGERKTILEGGSDARFVRTGHLIYAVGGILFAAPFNVDSLELQGAAVPVVEGVRRGTSGALQLAVSNSGTLVYMPGPTGTDQSLRALAIGDRSGAVTRLPLPPAAYSHVRVSRDGERAAIGTDDGKDASVLIYSLKDAGALQRLTLQENSRFPVWSPDGRWIAFASTNADGAGIFRQRADGTGAAERLTTAQGAEIHVPESWSSDGQLLSFNAFMAKATARTMWALWMLSLADRKTAAFAEVRSTEPTGSVFSPDGKWLAYAIGTGTATSANRGVFVQPVPPTGAIYQAPRQIVDFHPVWSASGSELVFTVAATAGQMAAVGVTTAGAVKFGATVRFPASVTGDRLSRQQRAWDLMPDGRIIGIVPADQAAPRSFAEMRLVLNWFEELQARVPVR